MKSWLTTHYPHPYPDNLPWHIYLQRNHKHAVDGIAEGDQVFFYEYKWHKPLKDGTQFPVGREGIVLVAFVSGSMRLRDPGDAVTEYADGTVGDWSWRVPTTGEDDEGFVGRKDVLDVLGYKPGGYLRGFNSGTGVMQLTETQAHKLMRLFKQGNS